jgi:hypothetical protein
VTLRGLVLIRKILSFRTGGVGPEESAGGGSGGQQIPPLSLRSGVGMTRLVDRSGRRNDKGEWNRCERGMK